jgi:hypothetical protein
MERLTKSYVEDAVTFARWILLDGTAMMSNLTSVQQRCTDLIEENRSLKRRLAEWEK